MYSVFVYLILLLMYWLVDWSLNSFIVLFSLWVYYPLTQFEGWCQVDRLVYLRLRLNTWWCSMHCVSLLPVRFSRHGRLECKKRDMARMRWLKFSLYYCSLTWFVREHYGVREPMFFWYWRACAACHFWYSSASLIRITVHRFLSIKAGSDLYIYNCIYTLSMHWRDDMAAHYWKWYLYSASSLRVLSVFDVLNPLSASYEFSLSSMCSTLSPSLL